MFPYNDDEMAWISKNPTSNVNVVKDKMILSIIFALAAALFSTLIPPLIYFFKLDLL